MKIYSTHLKLKNSLTHVTLTEFWKLCASCNISQETAESRIWLILKEVRQTRVCGEEWHMLHYEQVFGNVFERRESTLHEEPYFLFPDVLKRWSSQINCTGIWSFLYYRERWYFIIWSYTLNGKWKMIFLKKYTEIDIFFRPSENMVFPKGAAPAHDLSCIIWKDWGFFLENMIFLPWAESERRPFPAGNTWKHEASPSEKKKNRKPDT